MHLPWGVGAQEKAGSYKKIVCTCDFYLCMKCMQQVDRHHGHAQADLTLACQQPHELSTVLLPTT